MAANLEKIMRTITNLLAKADDRAASAEEAATYRAKAEELLAKYRLEEDDLVLENGEIMPVYREIIVTRTGAEFKDQHFWLWLAVARHCAIRHTTGWKRDPQTNQYGYVAQVVGYDVDVRLAELIFASALLVFGQHLEPEVDKNESDAENVYRLRSAGIPRNRIANMLWGASMGSDGAPSHGKAGRLYKEECERRGEDAAVSGRQVNAKTYRAAYARSFVGAFERRLREARDAANAAVGALVSVGRLERVDEAFYTRFPSERPTPVDEAWVDDKVQQVVKVRKSKALSRSAEARLNREYYGPAAMAAGAAARTAAAKVRLDRTAPANRLAEPTGQDAKEIGS